jgi:hypothetical protein
MRTVSLSALSTALFLAGCSGTPEPSDPAQSAPAPTRAEAPKSGLAKIDAARAPMSAPEPVAIDLETADPMAIVEARGPGGEPARAMSLVVASRGDGEIEPCG